MECLITECTNKVHSKGLCQNHYRQAKRRERGLQKPGPKPDPTAPRSRHGEARKNEGKGRFLLVRGGVCSRGHVLSENNVYEYPDGKLACKRCRIRISRKKAGSDIPLDAPIKPWNKDKTHCANGHEFTEENTYITPEGFRSCRTCKRINDFTYRAKKYGMTGEELLGLYEAQNYKCAGCQEETTLHIDHDHSCCPQDSSCGKCVRGLLCSNCNNGLGRLKDSTSTMLNLVEYIRKYRTTNKGQY